MHKDVTFPVRGKLWVFIHSICSIVSVILGASIEILPDEEASWFLSFLDEFLHTEDQGSDLRISSHFVVIPGRYD